MRPFVSVITATYQNAAALSGCLASVAGQQDASFEHIVIDGGSTDASRTLLEAWTDQLAAWSSESDSGIAEAMNKGVTLAKGDWILFLHADDRFYSDNTLASISQFLDTSDADIVAFPILFGEHPPRIRKPRGASRWLRLKTGIWHQGAFIRRSAFHRIGLHDPELKIVMDYDFFLRAWLGGLKFVIHDAPVVARMNDGGISSRLDWPSMRRRLAEERSVHFSHAHNFLMRISYKLYWLIYPLYKRLSTEARLRFNLFSILVALLICI